MSGYASVPQQLEAVAFVFFGVPVHWYGLMWLAAVATTIGITVMLQRRYASAVSIATIMDACFWGFCGALLGGRLGYVLFYQFAYYRHHIGEIFSPYDFATETWVGLAGFSYHGGVLGVLLALTLFARQQKVSLRTLTDLFVPGIACGYTWGRVGNFLNGELYGRPTASVFGMEFVPGDVLRHPSQLYEACLEGLVLGVLLLWLYPRMRHTPGAVSAVYIAGYGVARFLVEFTRMPDAHLGLLWAGLSMGQWLSIAMIVGGGGLFVWCRARTAQ